jgi:hypothetical protein
LPELNIQDRFARPVVGGHRSTSRLSTLGRTEIRQIHVEIPVSQSVARQDPGLIAAEVVEESDLVPPCLGLFS